MSIGIYKITSPSGKVYIGQSTNIEKRWKYYLSLNCKNQIKLFNSLKKYGPGNHKFEIIEECSENVLEEREIYWGHICNTLNDGLNLRLGNKRGKWSKETLIKMSKSQSGKIKGDYHTDEFKEKISLIQKGNKNRLNINHTEETKQKISKSNSKSKPEGFGNKISVSNIGISRNKGRIVTQKTKEKMSNNITGKKSKFKQKLLLENIENIKNEYGILSLNNIAEKYNVSHFTMRNFLKENNIFEFRKNYRN